MKLGIVPLLTALFGLGALVLSIAMGGIFVLHHPSLPAGRARVAAQHQAFANAVVIPQLSYAGLGDTI